MNMTITMGPQYLYAQLQTIYTVAPHGTVLCKQQGGKTWIASAMTKAEFERAVKAGRLVRR